MAIGTNDMRWISRDITRSRVEGIIKQIGPNRQILWVDTYAGGAQRFTRPKERWFNHLLGVMAHRHANVRVITWAEHARTTGVLFSDGMHYTFKGWRVRAELIRDELDAHLGVKVPIGV